ncbi:RNA polymerase sigma factor [Flavobacterium algicola]|uniref:RNA polymerase sigma factor n=1 Tax=Flavobacterium algicola TaxID=556529 RepID=UPI001EFD264D|nr:sigma-70 family RNA polymerase sigma factor [Flavobacterium algicola]MCG9792564.1 sigma-70 family RNA polymerase sigma factor [Flavobacterium algicola]
MMLFKMNNSFDFEEIYNKHWEKLTAFSLKITQDSYLSQNVVQDVFIDLLERKNSLQIDSIENYLFRAVKNQIFKNYRNDKFDKTILEDKFENYVIDNFNAIDTELTDKIYILIDGLPEKRREILLMNKLQDMNIDQIAAELDLSRQTVKNQISSAIKQLRQGLKEFTFLFL